MVSQALIDFMGYTAPLERDCLGLDHTPIWQLVDGELVCEVCGQQSHTMNHTTHYFYPMVETVNGKKHYYGKCACGEREE